MFVITVCGYTSKYWMLISHILKLQECTTPIIFWWLAVNYFLINSEECIVNITVCQNEKYDSSNHTTLSSTPLICHRRRGQIGTRKKDSHYNRLSSNITKYPLQLKFEQIVLTCCHCSIIMFSCSGNNNFNSTWGILLIK